MPRVSLALGIVLFCLVAAGCPNVVAAEPWMAGTWVAVRDAVIDDRGRVYDRPPPRIIEIERDATSFEALVHAWIGADREVQGDGDTLESRWISEYSSDGRWYGDQPSEPIIEELNRRRLARWFEATPRPDEQRVDGRGNDHWVYWSNDDIDDIDDIVEVTYDVVFTRTDIALRFVRETRNGWRPVRSVGGGDRFAVEIRLGREVGAERFRVILRWEARDEPTLALEARPLEGDLVYRSGPVAAIRPVRREDVYGLESDGSEIRVWSPRGATLMASLGPLEPASLIVRGSILEGIMEVTSAVVLFALLAFMVERLTNGLALLLGYLRGWRAHFEVIEVADPVRRAANERNRRVALFVIGVVLAVPGAVALGIDPISQLLLQDLPGPSGEIATGLLAASGADPIREMVRMRDRPASEQAPVQVTGTLILQQPASGPVDARGEDRPA